MTANEKDSFSDAFPAMNVELQPRVTAEATAAYNCIAWTVGITNAWIDPVQSLQEWDDFYQGHGYVRAQPGAAGHIAVWKTDAEYTHGSVANAQEGFGWESKCGQDLRILHHQADLVGDIYGRPIAYYVPAPANTTTPSSLAVAPTHPAMTEDQQAARLHDLVKNVPAPVREDFLNQFHAWKKTWFAGRMALSSYSLDRGNTHSYHQLLAMGPEIIPLVVEQLQNPANFMAVQLYNDLQTEPAMRAALAAAKPHPSLGLQGKARSILQLHLKPRG